MLCLYSSFLLIIPRGGYADEMSDLFFEEIETEENIAATVLFENRRYSGKFKTEFAYNTEEKDKALAFSRKNAGLSKLKTSLTARFEDKIGTRFNYKMSANGFYDAYYDIKGKDDFSTEQVNTFKAEAELGENYLSILFAQSFRLTIGRQIIVWGESEVNPVVDIINPRNVRELGQTPLDESRLPVSVARLSMVNDSLEVDFIYSFEFRGDKTGVDGSDFDPYISLRSALSITEPRKPYSFFGAGEQYLRLKRQFKDADFSLFLSNSFNKSETLEYNTNQQVLSAIYKKYQLLGLSGNYATGSWLTRFELAYKHDIAEPRGDLLQQIDSSTKTVSSWSEKDIIQSTLGAEYYGLNNTTITVEWSPTTILDYDENLRNDKLRSTYLFFVQRTFLKERVALDFSWFKFSNGGGDIIRTNLEYEYQDGIRFSISYIVYEANKKGASLYNYRNNDRIFSSISYFF